ncbi:methyltransferase family protein [Flagellimonas sp.]|uniref:methyltransferase family protein n=1 Tax=Flagellimonas sp. TaxID=2058762 RepID=UPI003B5A19E1
MKILPPFVMLIFAGLMYVLAKFLPVGDFDFFGRIELAIFLFSLALLVTLLALFQFARAKTTSNPFNLSKTSALVTNGIYKFTRNPMYLGLLLLLLAFGLKMGNAFNTLLAAGFVYYMNHFQIKKEEEALLGLFGKEYSAYCKATRRWF